METTKRYPITAQYEAVVTVSTPAVWIYIVKKSRVFFGLFPWSERVSFPIGFELGEKEGYHIANQMYAQEVPFSLSHVCLAYRNIDTFDLETEIAIHYNAMMEKAAEKNRREKLMEDKLNNILK